MNRNEARAYERAQPVSRIQSIQKTTDNVYLNIVFDHPEYNSVVGAGGHNYPTRYITGEGPTDAIYNVTKTEAILDKCSDYYASVTRFLIPLDELPILVCDIIPNQADPNLTPYIIGIDLNGIGGPLTKYPVNCLYNNQNVAYAEPTQNSRLQIVTPYYYIYSYDQIVGMFNTALLTSWTNSGLAALFPNYLPPYFFLDHTTNLVNLVVPQCFIKVVAPLTIQPTIFFNTASQNFLDAFNSGYSRYDSPQGNDIYLILVPLDYPENYYYPNGVTVPSPTSPSTGLPTAPPYYKFIQQYSVLEYWVSARKLVMTTTSIPIRNEYSPTINNQENGTNNSNSNGLANSIPLLTDFVLQIDNSAGSSRSIAYYIPSAQYRLTDLLSDNPLQAIDIRISWVDKNGNLYPLQLSVLQQASLKILFTRKSLYNHTHDMI